MRVRVYVCVQLATCGNSNLKIGGLLPGVGLLLVRGSEQLIHPP